MRRALIALTVVMLVLGPGAVAQPVNATASTYETTDALRSPLSASVSDGVFLQQANETPTPNGTSSSSTSTTSSAAGERPETAETVRILPIQLEPEFMSVETADAGERFNTSGPVAFFTLSEPVDQAAIQQPGARARILEGGQTIVVEYDRDAAPPGEQSFYQLQLFFADGSSRTVEIFASRTDVDVGSTGMADYRPAILEILDDAEDAGYERDPDGLLAHYEEQRETAQLLDNLFAEQAIRLWGSIISILVNPLGIAAILIIIALVALYLLRSNRQVLEILTNSSSPAAQLRERLWIQYKQSQQTAADESLGELVGAMNEIYWHDAFEIDTVAGLAELFRTGVPVRRDGEIEHVGGVDDLDPDTIHSSWIEAVTRDHRLPSVELALSDGKKALHRMVTKYGMGHVYGDAYKRTVELIDELDESRDLGRHATSSRSKRPGGAGAPAGGDDD